MPDSALAGVTPSAWQGPLLLSMAASVSAHLCSGPRRGAVDPFKGHHVPLSLIPAALLARRRWRLLWGEPAVTFLQGAETRGIFKVGVGL